MESQTLVNLRVTHWIQRVMGLFVFLFQYFPYVRKVRGRVGPRGAIYVANHTSLLDTFMVGGFLWTRCRMPMLVLGDKATWKKNRLRRLLSARVGFLIDRDTLSKALLHELRTYARLHDDYTLLVFPEGTRGDGTDVGECQPGIYFVAREAKAPIVPVFVENMRAVSSKRTRLHLLGGLRKITLHVGEPFEYEGQPRDEFLELVREKIRGARAG